MTDESPSAPAAENTESPKAATTRLLPLIVAVAAVALLAVVAVLFRPSLRAPQGGLQGSPGAAATAVVPTVIGLSDADARAALGKAGFAWIEAATPVAEKPLGEVLAQYPVGGANLRTGTAVALQLSASTTVTTSLVPNVVGLDRDGAHSALSSADFVSAVVTADSTLPVGQVFAQVPAGGNAAESGSAVVIQVSSGVAPAPASVAVPDVTGRNGAVADRAIRRAGFKFQPVESFSASVPEGNVIFQVPSAGTLAAEGSVVAAVVSIGANPQTAGAGVPVPQVIGRTLAQATQALSDVGLLVVAVPQPSTSKSAGTVLATLPIGGSSIVSGTKVLVVYVAGAK